jgi:hypothetical protein
MQKIRRIVIVLSALFAVVVAAIFFYSAIVTDRSSYGQPLAVFAAAILFPVAAMTLSSLKQKSTKVGILILGVIFLLFLAKGIHNAAQMPQIFVTVSIFLLGLGCAYYEQKWENEKFSRLALHLGLPVSLIIIGLLSAVDPGP